MERTLNYILRTTPSEILEIARNRIEDYPSAEIDGNLERGTLLARGIKVEYCMEQAGKGTRLKLTFRKKPPVPWTLVKSYLDREARKW